MRNLNHLSVVTVLLVAGGWNVLSAQTVYTSPTSLQYSALFQGAAGSQQLTIISNLGAVAFTITPVATNPQWLKVNGGALASGTTPATVTVTADPTGLSPNTYTSSLSVLGAGSSTAMTVTVTFTVSTVGVSPTAISFQPYTQGGAIPATQSLTVSGGGAYTASATTQTGGPWLSVSPTTGNAPGGVFASLNAPILAGLAVGAYQGSVTITPISGASMTAIVVPVSLTVVPTPPVTVNPTSMIFNVQQGASGNITNQMLTIATTPGQQLNYSIGPPTYPSGTPQFLTVSPTSGNTDVTSGAAQVTVGYNLNGLTVGNTYSGTFTVFTSGGTPPQTPIQVTLNYSSTPLLNVPTNTLNFLYESGGGFPLDQSVNITSTNGSLITYAVGQSANSSWLTVPNSGSTGAPLNVHVNPAALVPGTYSALINITPANGSPAQQIPVVLKVGNDPLISSNVASMAFPFQIGQQAPATQTFQVTSSNGVPLTFTATPTTTNCGSSWLLLNSATNPVTGTTSVSAPISVSIATAGLSAGTCTGAINIAATNTTTGTAAINSPISIPVTLTVATTPMLVTLPAALSFAVPAGGQSPLPQAITLSSTSGTDVLAYSITGINQGGAPSTWLSAAPISGITSSANVITVNVFSTSLPAGSYSGSVSMVATNSAGIGVANNPVTVPVSLQVTSGSLTLSTTSLSFPYTVGAASPPTQTVTVGSSTTNPLVFSAVATSSPTAWLSVTPTGGTTGSSGTLTVAVDGTKLATPGTYNGSITVTSPGAGNSPATVNVKVVVSAGTISAPTATLSFAQVSGGPAPSAQTIAVTGSPVPLNFTVTSSTTPAGGTWLSATPASGTTPGSVSVSVNGGSLGAGQYTGQVIITSASATGSPITVPVVLNVTAIPKPVITAVGNAASYATGPLSPGENVTIFGTGIGPATLVSNVPVNGSFGTTVGTTRVLFDGVAAPIIYASATQTSVMVPYGVNGRTSTSIVVEFTGVQSSPINFSVAGSAPGIYTLNSQGTGPGAILNQDGVTVNGPNTPEKRGNVIAVYMTGEGQTSPGGVDGAVIPPVASALKNPVLPVTATIGGVAVTGSAIAYAGSAPGLISGVMQVNLVIPQNAPAGSAVPIAVTVGTNNSQSGVTVAIQ